MQDYYSRKLAADRLRRCYEIAPPSARAYLRGEIDHVASRLVRSDLVLELGCGYGRVLAELADRVQVAWGVDTSLESLRTAREYVDLKTVKLAAMDAVRMGFRDNLFDAVICIQNGISAFAVDPGELLHEAVRVARPGGLVLFSSYAECFWESRLEWFEAQAAEGLLGPIDHDATGEGTIVCKDGFSATAVSPERFRTLSRAVGVEPLIREIDRSSLFCELRVPDPGGKTFDEKE